jgi:DNA modification methylase
VIDRLRAQLARYLDDPEQIELVERELALFLEQAGPPRNGHAAGRQDPRNMLNDLSGAEWVFFLNSVEATAYPTRGPGSFAHDLRKIHPSPKPPQLMSKIIQFFSKKGGWVLDPFMGVGGTLLGAALCERHAAGIDLDERYIEAYTQVCTREHLAPQVTIHGDARAVAALVRAQPGLPAQFDLLLTDPPYGNMLAREQTGEKKKRTGQSDPTPFTDQAADLGNLPLAEFLAALREVIASSLALLKPKGYCIVFCKDIQPTPAHHNMLHADVVEELLKIEGLAFKGYKIWYDKTPNLYPFGYPFSFVANQLHQYILIFRKEPEPKKPRARAAQAATPPVAAEQALPPPDA